MFSESSINDSCGYWCSRYTLDRWKDESVALWCSAITFRRLSRFTIAFLTQCLVLVHSFPVTSSKGVIPPNQKTSDPSIWPPYFFMVTARTMSYSVIVWHILMVCADSYERHYCKVSWRNQIRIDLCPRIVNCLFYTALKCSVEISLTFICSFTGSQIFIIWILNQKIIRYFITIR